MVSPLEALLTTNGWRTVSSLTTKATKAAAEIATHHVIVGELKQSSSCPLSSTN